MFLLHISFRIEINGALVDYFGWLWRRPSSRRLCGSCHVQNMSSQEKVRKYTQIYSVVHKIANF